MNKMNKISDLILKNLNKIILNNKVNVILLLMGLLFILIQVQKLKNGKIE